MRRGLTCDRHPTIYRLMSTGHLLRLLPILMLFAQELRGGSIFRVATYNLENYLDAPSADHRPAKTSQAKAAVQESIRAINPDVLALQEVGSLSALAELRASLKSAGLDFPNWEYVTGYDTNIHLAVLSKLPISARRPHTNQTFLLSGRRFYVSRGFAEIDVRLSPGYCFTLISAHLKSKLPIAAADQAEFRLEEARLLRQNIESRFQADPNVNLVVLGDLNDTKDSASTRLIIGRGKPKLVDTRPAEHNPADSTSRAASNVAWTYYFSKEDIYSRIDYILLSPGIAREWKRTESYVLALPDWSAASDHRPLVAAFEAEDL